MKINLGCGKKHKEDFINADIVEPYDTYQDVTEDWQWDDNSADRIEADNLVEHLDNEEYLHFMNEAHRVLKSDGKLWLRLPDACNWFEGAAGDPTHKMFFCYPRSFQYLQHDHPTHQRYGSSYGFKPWNMVEGGTDGKFIKVTLMPVK